MLRGYQGDSSVTSRSFQSSISSITCSYLVFLRIACVPPLLVGWNFEPADEAARQSRLVFQCLREGFEPFVNVTRLEASLAHASAIFRLREHTHLFGAASANVARPARVDIRGDELDFDSSDVLLMLRGCRRAVGLVQVGNWVRDAISLRTIAITALAVAGLVSSQYATVFRAW